MPTGACVGEAGDLRAHLSGGKLKSQCKTAFILKREVLEILLGRSKGSKQRRGGLVTY